MENMISYLAHIQLPMVGGGLLCHGYPNEILMLHEGDT